MSTILTLSLISSVTLGSWMQLPLAAAWWLGVSQPWPTLPDCLYLCILSVLLGLHGHEFQLILVILDMTGRQGAPTIYKSPCQDPEKQLLNRA